MPSLAECRACACGQSLDNAIVTDRRSVSAAAKKKLGLLTRRIFARKKGAE
jgi:hypothetical protein